MIIIGLILFLFCGMFALFNLSEQGWSKATQILLGLAVAGSFLVFAEVSIYANNVEDRMVDAVITNNLEVNDENTVVTLEPVYIETWKRDDFGKPTLLSGDYTYKVYTLQEAEELGKISSDTKRVFVPLGE